MVISGIAIFSVAWALLLTFMLRHPNYWATFIDRNHLALQKYGLSARWMQSAEKGVFRKLIVGATILLSPTCAVVLMKHPTALHDYLNAHMRFRGQRFFWEAA